MPSSVFRSFADPDTYFAEIRNLQVIGLVTQRGEFRAELTCIDLNRLWMHRFNENLPQTLRVRPCGKRALIIFPTDPEQSPMLANGIEMPQNLIVSFGLHSDWYLRSSAATAWGLVSLMPQDLATAAKTIVGRELTPPTFMHFFRPPMASLSRLRKLHQAADHLAKTAPDILAKPEIAREMERALPEATVWCLADGPSDEVGKVHRQRAQVMRRLEEMLTARSEEPLYVAEICAAVGVSYSTLRQCCQKYVGMSPKRYLWMRRMNLARSALGRAESENTTVTKIATDYGFWELGRFSVAYRSLFGESPSATLRRDPFAVK